MRERCVYVYIYVLYVNIGIIVWEGADPLLSFLRFIRIHRNLVYMCGFCASLTSILLGYDVSLLSHSSSLSIHGPTLLGARVVVIMSNLPPSSFSSSFHHQVGIMSVARKYVDNELNLNNVQSEVIMGSLNLIAAFGGR